MAWDEFESTILLLICSSSSSLSLNSDESLSIPLDWLWSSYKILSFIPTIRLVFLALGRMISSASLLRFQIISFISYDVCLSGLRILGDILPPFGFLLDLFLFTAYPPDLLDPCSLFYSLISSMTPFCWFEITLDFGKELSNLSTTEPDIEGFEKKPPPFFWDC